MIQKYIHREERIRINKEIENIFSIAIKMLTENLRKVDIDDK